MISKTLYSRRIQYGYYHTPLPRLTTEEDSFHQQSLRGFATLTLMQKKRRKTHRAFMEKRNGVYPFKMNTWNKSGETKQVFWLDSHIFYGPSHSVACPRVKVFAFIIKRSLARCTISIIFFPVTFPLWERRECERIFHLLKMRKYLLCVQRKKHPSKPSRKFLAHDK